MTLFSRWLNSPVKVFESSIDSMTEEDLQAINKIVVEAKKVSQFGVSLSQQGW